MTKSWYIPTGGATFVVGVKCRLRRVYISKDSAAGQDDVSITLGPGSSMRALPAAQIIAGSVNDGLIVVQHFEATFQGVASFEVDVPLQEDSVLAVTSTLQTVLLVAELS